jgi:hypothetical protein
MAKTRARGANGRFLPARSGGGGSITRRRGGGGGTVLVLEGRGGGGGIKRKGRQAAMKAFERRALIGAIGTGLALGEIRRSNTEVPHIDILGKNGTIAAALVAVDIFIRPKGELGEWLSHAAAAASGIAAYEWRSTGTVAGRGGRSSSEMRDRLDRARGGRG